MAFIWTGPVVMEKNPCKSHQFIFAIFFPFEEGVTLHLIKLELLIHAPILKDAICKVWLNLTVQLVYTDENKHVYNDDDIQGTYLDH